MRSKAPTHQRAKQLRAEMTPPERLLWARLRNRATGLPAFRRQHPLGPYILDLYCAKAKLAVGIDGQSHDALERALYDIRRQRFIEDQGIRVLRYLASDVMRDPNGIANAIVDVVCDICR